MKPLPNTLLVSVLLLTFISLTAGPLIPSEKQALEGNVYNTILNDSDDLLTFQDGFFQSKFYAERGYDKGVYTTVGKGNRIWFEAKIVSLHEGEIFWKGVIKGNLINGSYFYTKKGWFIFGDTTKKIDFNGSLKTE